MSHFLEIDEFDPEKAYFYQGVCFDPWNGSGATGNTSNVNYMGLVLFIKPEQFLEAAITRGVIRDSEAFFRDVLLEGEHCIGPPQLYLERSRRGREWIVTGHEGRHRASAMEYLDLSLIPVYTFIRNYGETRARSINAEIINSFTNHLIWGEQKENYVSLRPEYVILKKKVYARVPDFDIVTEEKKILRFYENRKKEWFDNRPEVIQTEKQTTPRSDFEDAFYYWSKPL